MITQCIRICVADDHPGGKRVLVREAGKDASKKFHSLHSPQVLDHYSDELLIGTIGSAADQKKDVSV
jgi:cytochrome b involved in lipid metabolism